MRFAVLVIVLLGIVQSTEARKFDYRTESLATYFRGTYGPSSVSDSAFGGSSGVGVSIDKRVATNLSGEFGVVIANPNMGLRLGAEILMPRNVEGALGKNDSGTELYSLDSKVLAIIPTANVEFYWQRSLESRIVVGAGVGFAMVSIDNKYKFTTDGNTALAPVTDHEESGSARSTTAQVFVGYETLFTDTVTATFDLGYRHAPTKDFKSSREASTFTGTQVKDTPLVNHDGSGRTVNLSGPYVGLTFKFYIGI